VSDVDAEREVTGTLRRPVYRDETLREGRIRGVVVDLDDVDLGLAR
jgi:hypothetical protein